MKFGGIQPLTRYLFTRGNCNVLAQLIQSFRLQFLRTSLCSDMKSQRILFESLIIMERALVIILSQIPITRHEYHNVRRKV